MGAYSRRSYARTVIMTRRGLTSLARAFDEARFGPARMLDLRTSLPTATEAVRRAEPWLRERQMARAGEVLIVTGRGRGSPGGHGVVREAVKKLLARLKRVGVVAVVSEQNPGAFIVELASIRTLFDIPARSRHRAPIAAEPDAAELLALDEGTRRELRRLAEYSLQQLGAPVDSAFVLDEMRRQFAVLTRGLSPDETDREGRLKFLIAASRAAFENDA